MPELNDKSLEELAAMLADPESIQRVTPEPTPVEPEVPEPEPEPVAPEPEPEKVEAPAEAAAPVVEAAPDSTASDAEMIRQAEEAKREALIAKLMAHNSRLAGRLGNLEKNQSRTQPEHGYVPEAGDDRVVELQQRLAQMEEAQREEARSRAVNEEVRSVIEQPYLKGLDPALVASVTQKHEAAWNEAIAESDPDLARLGVRAVLLTVAAEARKIQMDKARADGEVRKAEQTKKLTEAKLKSSISGSGSAISQKPPEKKLMEHSVKELEQMLDRMTG